MKQNLKHSFFQVFTAVFVWLTFITTKVFMPNTIVSIDYLWNILGGTLVFALLFGVMYNALWYHFTLKPIWNIVIATVANTVGSLTFLWLVFGDMFTLVWKWTPVMLILSLMLHIIAFHFYAKYESEKNIEILKRRMQE